MLLQKKIDTYFRKATLLDIPFIFNLIQDGSYSGSFDQLYLTSEGYVQLLYCLFLDVLYSNNLIKCRTGNVNLFILARNHENIGAIKIFSPFADENNYLIELCAINPEYRNQKYGTNMITMAIETLPKDAEVVAYCTKYSRVMQNVFKSLNFKRDKKYNDICDECYRFTKSY